MLEDTDRLLGTVDQVLKASEVRQRGAKKNWQDLNFSELVQQSVELVRLRHGLGPEAIHFGSDPPGNVTTMGNSEELRTAVANLLENAVKYSRPQPEVVVDLLTPDMDTIHLRVRDNGIGIARPELKRIFKRFYRALNAGVGPVKGTGLGLFIVRSVARRHGGDVRAESEGEGRGSTFTLSLPRVYRL
jgi:signal transduction histidine kinase